MYGSRTIRFEFDDRVLAHLQAVVGSKLRRNEGFMMSWLDPQSVGDGRSAIWVHREVPILFRYDGSRPIPLNRRWLNDLAESANSTGGLIVTEEPGADEIAHSDDNSVKRDHPVPGE